MATTTARRSTAGAVLMLLVTLLLGACGSDDYSDAGYVRPAPVVNPTTGERCTAWVNNPHEADGSGLRACDYPIPQTAPVRSSGMSDADFAMLGFMFGYGAGHSDFFFRPSYYDTYIGPAWSRYPGTYYGYGHQPVARVSNVSVYNTTIHNYDSTNASKITTAKADPKFSGYTDTKTGKSYTGKNVPTKAFSGGSSTYTSGGNAKVNTGSSGSSSSNSSTNRSNTSTGKNSGSWGSGSGKGGYSGGSSGRSGGSSGGGKGK